MMIQRRKSDEALLKLWRSGHITSHQMTVRERYRLWVLVLEDALKEAKGHRATREQAEDAALVRKTPAA